MEEQLLEVKNLTASVYSNKASVRVLSDISFSIVKGEILGIVGESGCGKSMTALNIMGLVSTRTGKVEMGSIMFENEELLQKNKEEMRKIRGNEIAMIFQEPMTSLNPVLTIGKQIGEVLKAHGKMKRKARKARSIELLNQVGIDMPLKRLYDYPHQLSGGMRQRVMIAMALACRPKLLIADEPTTALDVTIQAQILEIIKDTNEKDEMSVLLISHDLDVIAQTANRVVVMYAGSIIENAPVEVLFDIPLHPYTQGLMASMPQKKSFRKRLETIKGNVPKMTDIPNGCRFSTRCAYAKAICFEKEPVLRSLDQDRLLRCWKGSHDYV